MAARRWARCMVLEWLAQVPCTSISVSGGFLRSLALRLEGQAQARNGCSDANQCMRVFQPQCKQIGRVRRQRLREHMPRSSQEHFVKGRFSAGSHRGGTRRATAGNWPAPVLLPGGHPP